MEPASNVVKLMGGTRPLSRLLGIAPSTVTRWQTPKERGGTGGLIPARRQARILQLAEQHGIAITALDLVAR